MIKTLPQFFLTVFFLFFAFAAFGQTGPLAGSDDKAKADDAVSSFKFGFNYISNDVFMGRTDTVTTPMIVPEAKYSLKSGIYFSGSLDILPNKPTQKLDGSDLTAGYEFDIGDNLSGSASFAKLFYSKTSTQIAAAISSTINANLTYDIGDIISTTVSVDYDLNKQGINNDVFVSTGLSHDFIALSIFGEKDILLISPTVTANTGTQNFYDAYLIKKKFKSVKRTDNQNILVTKYINQLGQYSILDYELSAPLEYKTGHFIFQFIPTYAIVENQLPKSIQSRLSNEPSVFYVETGVSLKF